MNPYQLGKLPRCAIEDYSSERVLRYPVSYCRTYALHRKTEQVCGGEIVFGLVVKEVSLCVSGRIVVSTYC